MVVRIGFCYPGRHPPQTRDWEWLAKDGQLLLPMMELIEASRLAVDEVIDAVGRASIEAILHPSAQGVAGAKHQGKKGGEVRWHGTQPGTVPLSNRKLRVGRAARRLKFRFRPMPQRGIPFAPRVSANRGTAGRRRR